MLRGEISTQLSGSQLSGFYWCSCNPFLFLILGSREYCEVYQEISQILIKYPVTTGISQGMAHGPTLRSKSTGRCNKRPAPFGTWNLVLILGVKLTCSVMSDDEEETKRHCVWSWIWQSRMCTCHCTGLWSSRPLHCYH